MLRPIDVTMTIQGSAEAHRAGQQGALAGRPEVQASMFADKLEKETRREMEQTNATTETDNPNVNPDQRGNAGGYNPNRKPKKPAANTPPKRKPVTGTESMFDVVV